MPKYICDKCKNEYEGKFCPECGDKTTKKDKEVMTDKEIINDLINDTKNKIKNIELHNKVSIVFFIISFIVATIGMYHKSMDSIIVGTALANSDEENKMVVVTADKALKAGMDKIAFPHISVI